MSAARGRFGRAAPAVAGVGLWQLAALTPWGHAHAVPSVRSVLVTLCDDGVAQLALDTGATLLRLSAGVAIAAPVGALAGVWLGLREERWRAAEPTVDFLRSIPPVLLYPLFLASAGYTERARVAAIAFGVSGVILLPTATALRSAPAARRDAVRLAGLTGWRAFRALHAYEALPGLLTGLRLALVQGLVIAVVTEMLVGASNGLGCRALQALQEYRADRLWLTIAVAGLVSQLLSSLVTRVERGAHAWAK